MGQKKAQGIINLNSFFSQGLKESEYTTQYPPTLMSDLKGSYKEGVRTKSKQVLTDRRKCNPEDTLWSVQSFTMPSAGFRSASGAAAVTYRSHGNKVRSQSLSPSKQF